MRAIARQTKIAQGLSILFEFSKPIFSDIKLKFTLRNMPPAFVYDCLK